MKIRWKEVKKVTIWLSVIWNRAISSVRLSGITYLYILFLFFHKEVHTLFLLLYVIQPDSVYFITLMYSSKRRTWMLFNHSLRYVPIGYVSNMENYIYRYGIQCDICMKCGLTWRQPTTTWFYVKWIRKKKWNFFVRSFDFEKIGFEYFWIVFKLN